MVYKKQKEWYKCPRCNAGKGNQEPEIFHEVVKPYTHLGKHYGYSIYCYDPDKEGLKRIPIGY
jgi:hypothetical protein